MCNIVTIDPSIVSTAVTINGKIFSLASDSIVFTKTHKMKKWFDLSAEYCEIIPINRDYDNHKKYQKLEIAKLESYQKTANLIRKLVDNHCDPKYNTLILIEGYSYSSSVGPLIDLVTLGTLIRRTLSTRQDTELVVLAPTSVKKLSAELTYKPIIKGKKVEFRNKQGLSGGSFKKPDIYKVLIENSNIDSEWVKFLRYHADDILDSKSIPKPIDDINDSVVMFHIAEKTVKDNQDFEKTIRLLREV